MPVALCGLNEDASNVIGNITSESKRFATRQWPNALAAAVLRPMNSFAAKHLNAGEKSQRTRRRVGGTTRRAGFLEKLLFVTASGIN